MITVTSESTLNDIESALRFHWDNMGANLSLQRYKLLVKDKQGRTRHFNFSKLDFSQFGRTPSALRAIVERGEKTSFAQWKIVEQREEVVPAGNSPEAGLPNR